MEKEPKTIHEIVALSRYRLWKLQQPTNPGDDMEEQKYKCPDCGWTGTEDEMKGDYLTMWPDDEVWTNCICPECEAWHDLDDYIVL